jgi:hypothetical protein
MKQSTPADHQTCQLPQLNPKQKTAVCRITKLSLKKISIRKKKHTQKRKRNIYLSRPKPNAKDLILKNDMKKKFQRVQFATRE